MEAVDLRTSQLTERRIAHLTLVLGAVAAIGACPLFSIRAGVGVLIGSMLAWLNFHWLEGAMDALVQVSTASAGAGEARVPVGPMFRFFGRYALIAAAVYAIFTLFKVPVLSMLVGLCALGAAAICASLYEVVRSTD